MIDSEVEKTLKTSAAGQYLGYAVQPVRLCHHLLRSPAGALVSMEVLDDVAVKAHGRVMLEQCKSSISPKKITDKSVDLWKSFGNWADTCLARGLNPSEVDFVLYVTPGIEGGLAKRLNDADKTASVELVSELRAWSAKTDQGTGFGLHLGRFLAAGDGVCASIIQNFRFVVENDPLQGIKEVLQATIPEESVLVFAKAAIGLAKADAEQLVRDGLDAELDASTFRARFQAFVRKYNLAGLLNSTTDLPAVADIEKTIQSAPTYVRQLAAIDLSPELVIGAVSAFLRTIADKTNWAADGVIVEESLSEFDQSLQQRFSLVRDEIEDLQAAHDVKMRGRTIYRRCASVELPLEGRSLPTHFVQGAYNILADDLRVGWHPEYKTLLGKVE